MEKVQCFVCGNNVEFATKYSEDEDAWQIPCGLHFCDCGNYGSELHDSMMSGEKFEIIVCDSCLKKNWYRGRLTKEGRERSQCYPIYCRYALL